MHGRNSLTSATECRQLRRQPRSGGRGAPIGRLQGGESIGGSRVNSAPPGRQGTNALEKARHPSPDGTATSTAVSVLVRRLPESRPAQDLAASSGRIMTGLALERSSRTPSQPAAWTCCGRRRRCSTCCSGQPTAAGDLVCWARSIMLPAVIRPDRRAVTPALSAHAAPPSRTPGDRCRAPGRAILPRQALCRRESSL